MYGSKSACPDLLHRAHQSPSNTLRFQEPFFDFVGGCWALTRGGAASLRGALRGGAAGALGPRLPGGLGLGPGLLRAEAAAPGALGPDCRSGSEVGVAGRRWCPFFWEGCWGGWGVFRFSRCKAHFPFANALDCRRQRRFCVTSRAQGLGSAWLRCGAAARRLWVRGRRMRQGGGSEWGGGCKMSRMSEEHMVLAYVPLLILAL